MRIFLSYASERRDVAEPIALALRNQGHTVFFDRDDLPPGASYDDRIRDAIAASHLLVFLISPESVADGRYTLTEPAVARRRWASPQGRVLPVQIVPTPLPAVPAYLKAVAILEPRGNVAAEVAAATAEIAGHRKRWRWPAVAGAAAALATAVAAIWQFGLAGDLALEAETAERAHVGLFGEAPGYLVRGQIHNGAPESLALAGLELETEPPQRLQVAAEWTLPADLEQRPAGSSASVALPVSLVGDAAATFRWRICTRPSGICSGWQAWDPQGEFEPALAFEVPAEVRRRAALAVAVPEGFVLALERPAALVQLTSGGAIGAEADLAGEPAALARWGDPLFVATRSPNAVAAYRAGSLEALWTRQIRFAGGPPETAFDEPPSTSPVSMAASDDALWLITGGGTGGAVLAYLSLARPAHRPTS